MIELIGHRAVKKQLADLIINSQLGHAYIFDGIDGIGKTTAAKWFAAAALCKEGKGTACGVCDSCKKIEADSHPDVAVISEDFVNQPKMISALPKAPGKRPIGANTVHAMRIARYVAATKPLLAHRKFIIIPDADELNIQGQNAILKVFEEPPSYMTIIMISNNSGALLNTIISRAVMYRFQPLSDSETKAVIMNYCDDEKAASELSRLCFGSPGTALGMLENPELIEYSRNVRKKFFDYARASGDMTSVLPLLTKEDISFALSCIAHEALLLSKNDFDNALHYINIFDIVQDIRIKLKNNCNFTLAVTDMLIRSWEELHG